MPVSKLFQPIRTAELYKEAVTLHDALYLMVRGHEVKPVSLPPSPGS